MKSRNEPEGSARCERNIGHREPRTEAAQAWRAWPAGMKTHPPVLFLTLFPGWIAQTHD